MSKMGERVRVARQKSQGQNRVQGSWQPSKTAQAQTVSLAQGNQAQVLRYKRVFVSRGVQTCQLRSVRMHIQRWSGRGIEAQTVSTSSLQSTELIPSYLLKYLAFNLPSHQRLSVKYHDLLSVRKKKRISYDGNGFLDQNHKDICVQRNPREKCCQEWQDGLL